MMFPFLNMVPDKLVFQPGDLLLSKLRIVSAFIMDGEPLSAFAADTGFHVAIESGLRHFPQPFCNARFYRRGRGPRSL